MIESSNPAAHNWEHFQRESKTRNEIRPDVIKIKFILSYWENVCVYI